MTVQDSTARRTGTTDRAAAPAWQHPLVRAEAAESTVYPYLLYVGDHDPVRVPMTAAALRSLRDALTALLAEPQPEPGDFVAEWAAAHGAVVYDAAATVEPIGAQRAAARPVAPDRSLPMAA
jgi:hypothetical protein